MTRVLIASFVPSFAYKVAMCLHAAGASSHMLGETRAPYGALSRYVARSARLHNRRPLLSPEPVADEIVTYCHRHRIDVVMSADYVFTLLLARQGHRFEGVAVMPLSDATLLDRLHNKWSFAETLIEAGLPVPPTRLITSDADIDTVDLDWPLMVKPLGMSDSLGVKRIDSPDALRDHVHTGAYGTAFPLLVQTVIDGHDIDLNFLADQGELVAWSVQTRSSYRAHALSFVRDDEVIELGRAIVAATGFHGVGHFDFRRGHDGTLYAIELNPRFWGSVQYSAWMGVNFPELVMKMALGADVRQRNFTPPEGFCDAPGLQPRAVLRSLRGGHLVPEGLSAGTRAAFISTHADPLPHLLRAGAGFIERVARGSRLGGG